MSQLRALDQIEDNIRGRWSLCTEYEKILFEAIDKCRELEALDNDSGLTPEQNKFMTSCTNASFKLNKKGLVNVNGHFYCSRKDLSDFMGIKFGIIKGDFNVSGNKFSSFDNFPTKVGGVLDCSNNKFTSLEGCPIFKQAEFGGNPLVSLRGITVCDSEHVVRFSNCEFVSQQTLNTIYCYMVRNKVDYDTAVSKLEPYIKAGINKQSLAEIFGESYYERYTHQSWNPKDWDNLSACLDHKDFGKAFRLLGRQEED